ncbi:unnamed protein product, partial [Effrenium voratum]
QDRPDALSAQLALEPPTSSFSLRKNPRLSVRSASGQLLDVRSQTLSYSFSVSKSQSNNSKVPKVDGVVQTDLQWRDGWHCCACARPPKMELPVPLKTSKRRTYPAFSTVAPLQGGWHLVDGPAGVAEWLQEFLIVGTMVHSRSHHFPLLQGQNGKVEMAGGVLELDAEGRLNRLGKSGHAFSFRRGDVSIKAPEALDESDLDTSEAGLDRAMSFTSSPRRG